ncbi:MAG: virulence factor Mce family protein [Acidimicrobiales bacterium]|nr:virulence factor Mce family protein [Acidimicrobiales bacterium]
MRRTILKLIAFAAVCGVFTAYLAFTIGNYQPLQHYYRMSASFDDVTGLLPNDNVKIAGVVVGKVTGIRIREGRALVQFQVRTSVKVPSDSSAAIRWRNLLGQRYVYLYPGTAPTVLGKGAHIAKTRSVVDIGELFNRLGPIVQAIDPKQVNTFLDTIVAALDGNQQKLRQTLDDLAVVASSLGSRDQAIGRLVDNLDAVTGAITDRDAQIRVVLDNLLQIAQTFSANTAVIDQSVTDLGDFSANLGALLDNNRGEIDRIIGNLRALTDEVAVKLPVLDHALGGLDEAAKRLFTASRYGEWLNQVIPCGSIAGAVTVSNPCITGAGSLPASSTAPPAGGGTPVSGPGALRQLLGGVR